MPDVTTERPAIAALPGAVAKDDAGNKLWARCGDGAWIEILELQPAGKRRMSAQDFLRGNPIPSDADSAANRREPSARRRRSMLGRMALRCPRLAPRGATRTRTMRRVW